MSRTKRVPLTATARQKYDGRWLLPGDPFDVPTEAEAADLIALRFAKRPTDKVCALLQPLPVHLAAAPTEEESSMPPQQKPKKPPKKSKAPRRGTYRRRDLRPEGETS